MGTRRIGARWREQPLSLPQRSRRLDREGPLPAPSAPPIGATGVGYSPVPFSYTIDPQLGLVRFHPGDSLPSLQELETVLDQLAQDPLFKPGFGVLVDRRHFTVEPDVGYVRGGISAIAARQARFGNTRWASITSHLASYGMGRMAEAYAEHRGVLYRIFTDEAEAMEWLLKDSKVEDRR